MGGDEFVVLLPDLTDMKVVEAIASNIVETLAVPIRIDGQEVPVSVSVGVCAGTAEQFDADAIMKNADAALYRAKESGRNRFQVFAREVAGILAVK
jgi:diguanylate cyclase (GGDEF)-like protein